MENLNAEQIKSDLEKWAENFDGKVLNFVTLGNALALITSQEQKIKELTEENERLRNRITCQIVLLDEKVEEIKNECLERIELDTKAIQADTVRKMQEALEHRIHSKLSYHGWYIKETVIAEIAKEVLEDG